MKLVVTCLALALVPSAFADFVDCQTSCKSCQENADEPEVVELYCSMCEECREKRRERLARRGLGHGPGHHVPAVVKYEDSGDFLKSYHRKPRIDRRPPFRTYLISSSAVTPAHHMQHYYTQRHLRPLREYQYENLDPDDVEFLKTIPDGCPTPPICEDPTTKAMKRTTTSTTLTTTTTTTTTPAPTCPPIPECVHTTTFRPPKKMTNKLRPKPQRYQEEDPPSCPCMPICIAMFCPCPCKVTTDWMWKPKRPRPEKTTHEMSSSSTEVEVDIDKKSNDYVYVYIGVPKNLNKLTK